MSASLNHSLKETILIVDDSHDSLSVLRKLLAEQGYTVRVSLNGRQALQSVDLMPPDLILLDILMPDLDGYQVCQQLKANPETQAIPIIFISARQETLDKVKAFEIGAADYISKPIETQEVLVRIEHQLNILRLQRQLKQENARLTQEIQDRQNAEAKLRISEASLLQIKEYSQIPLLRCYASQLNQVIMMLIENAIDALQTDSKFHNLKLRLVPTITVSTELRQSKRRRLKSLLHKQSPPARTGL
ncbi:MAG: response regulator [Coleofasciculus sp.]